MDTRRRLAELDPDDEDPSPFEAAPSLSANKLARFTGALPHTTRKSKSERERELEAERAKKQEEEAAAAYNEFVEAFGGDEETGPETHSRGGGTGRGRGPLKGFVRAGGEEKYNPLAAKPPPPPPPSNEPRLPPTGPKGFSAPSGPRAMMGNPVASTSASKAPISTKPPQGRPTAMNFMDDDEPTPAPKATGVLGKKKREGDNFLEQLKRDQAAREERLRQKAGYVGSSVTALAARENAPTLTGNNHYDLDDPLTTNVHVGGLPQNATEESLGKLFAQYGGVGSVKIMWPRLESGQLNTTAALGHQGRKLGGFVAFLRRGDAEKAVKDMDGAEWGDSILRCGWGKAVPIAARALYEPERGSAYSSHRSSRRRHSSRSASPPSRGRDRSASPNDPQEFLKSKRRRSSYSRSRSRSRSPPSRSRRRGREWPELEEGVDEKFLVTVANKIKDHGKGFEGVLREREKGNPKFAFLNNEELPSHHYFKMLVDRDYEPPAVARFNDEGNHEIYSSDSSEDSEQDRVGKGKLGRLAQKRFEALLRGLTSTRERIAKGMSFALEHADCAAFIADLLVCSLTIDTTPVPRKLARLHLISDILHNASASLPNAWVYRSIFEKRLEKVFDHLGDVYLSFPGRMKAEQFRGMVEKVIDVWDKEWLVFEPKVIEDYKRRLSGVDSVLPQDYEEPTSTPLEAHSESPAPPFPPQAEPQVDEVEAEEKKSFGGFKMSFKAANFAPAKSTSSSSLQPETAQIEGADDIDLDGAPVGSTEEIDVDGAEIDVDGAEIDVDGADVDGEELDGAPVTEMGKEEKNEEDQDGEAMEMDSDQEGAGGGDIFK
ncbi:RRM and SURP domain-containing protein [Sporobolomyces salmoneus]|uniref:RRM and SURP domain-containing protein n=1 Tax=Sporobolomyces salmoneus TaxID=183962 RepID=UPI00316F6809